MAPGSGPVKIAAALTIAAAGFGGGFAYKKFRKVSGREEAAEGTRSIAKAASVHVGTTKNQIGRAQTEHHSKADEHSEKTRDEVEAETG